jgi:NAD(P)-dependent dehydrogenase (short-subunit alcohol dehydrogenase family)
MAAIETWLDEISLANDGIDGLVCCAGIVIPCPKLHEMKMNQFTKIIDVNMYGTVYFNMVVLRHFMRQNEAKRTKPQGGYTILNMGSKGSVEGLPGSPAYTASKHAVLGLTRVVAKDYAADGVRCNCLCPYVSK